MKSLFRLSAALSAMVVLAGCFESDVQTVLFPDGSGKIVWTMGVKVKDDEQEPFNAEDTDKMEQAAEGIVAWSEPKVVKEKGFHRVTMVAYFEDISKVRFMDDKKDEKGNLKTILTFELVKNGDGGTVTIHDTMIENALKEMARRDNPPKTDDEKKEYERGRKEAKEMIEGLKLSEGFQAPGAITASARYSKVDGRLATVLIDDHLMIDGMDDKPEALKTMEALTGDRSATWTKSEVPDDEMTAFRKELADAKAAWAKKKGDGSDGSGK